MIILIIIIIIIIIMNSRISVSSSIYLLIHPIPSYNDKVMLPKPTQYIDKEGVEDGQAVAQEVRVVVWQREGCWFDPRAPPS